MSGAGGAPAARAAARPLKWFSSDRRSGAASTSMHCPPRRPRRPVPRGRSGRARRCAWIALRAARRATGTIAHRARARRRPRSRRRPRASMMSIAASSASAMGRSKCEPSLARSAGDKFTVMRLGGSERPRRGDRGTHAFAAFGDRLVGQADQRGSAGTPGVICTAPRPRARRCRRRRRWRCERWSWCRARVARHCVEINLCDGQRRTISTRRFCARP
jgi:hypothetical protein